MPLYRRKVSHRWGTPCPSVPYLRLNSSHFLREQSRCRFDIIAAGHRRRDGDRFDAGFHHPLDIVRIDSRDAHRGDSDFVRDLRRIFQSRNFRPIARFGAAAENRADANVIGSIGYRFPRL